MSDISIVFVFGVASVIKLLLIPSYKSTDFEVHRNWLAITHSLPISRWYLDATSEWTLDYPPFFALFECVLSQIAQYFDPAMLLVNNLNYSTLKTVQFQRLSVIVTDLMLFYSTQQFGKLLLNKNRSETKAGQQCLLIVSILILCNFGLFIIDHIHFQYNGFLFGMLLLSVTRLIEGRMLLAAFWFSVLLNFKHIFLYLAPAYFIYLLKSYCFYIINTNGRVVYSSFSFRRLFKLGVIVLLVFLTSFGPFLYLGQLPQVTARLFPFKRGLSHAYWAPNFWSIYNVADKAISVCKRVIGLTNYNRTATASMTGGLVQQFTHSELPNITPVITLIITLVSILPIMYKIWSFKCNSRDFLRSLVLCAFGSYMFGWHVHEKAVLLMIIPLALLTVMDIGSAAHYVDVQTFTVLSIVGHYSLFPLIFTKVESITKVLLFVFYTGFTIVTMSQICKGKKLLAIYKVIYICGLPVLYVFTDIVFCYMLPAWQSSLPFLPLMVTSFYTSIGISYTYMQYYYYYFALEFTNSTNKTKQC